MSSLPETNFEIVNILALQAISTFLSYVKIYFGTTSNIQFFKFCKNIFSLELKKKTWIGRFKQIVFSFFAFINSHR